MYSQYDARIIIYYCKTLITLSTEGRHKSLCLSLTQLPDHQSGFPSSLLLLRQPKNKADVDGCQRDRLPG